MNLTGVWLCGKYVLPYMIEAGSGAIVNQASIGGMRGVARLAAYCASKAGVIGLTRQMAVDYGPLGIRVNAIAPGTIPTPLVRGLWAQGAGLVQGQTHEEQMRKRRASSIRCSVPGPRKRWPEWPCSWPATSPGG